MQIDSLIWLLLAGVTCGLEAHQVYRRSKDPKERARRAFARAKNTPIGEVRNGASAKVTGTVSAVGPMMTSPLTGRECIGFWGEVDHVDQNSLVTKKQGHCGPFSIADDTGHVILDGPLMLARDEHELISQAPGVHLDFLERIGVTTMDTHSVVRETLLRPGDRVTAFGLTYLEPDPNEHAVRSSPLVPWMRGSDSQPTVIWRADGDAPAQPVKKDST